MIDSQVRDSIKVGKPYEGSAGSFIVDIEIFKQEVSENTELGENYSTMISGSTIEVDPSGGYRIPPDDTATPVPILMTLEPITLAFDKKLWTKEHMKHCILQKSLIMWKRPYKIIQNHVMEILVKVSGIVMILSHVYCNTL